VILNTEDEEELGIDRVDVNAVANGTKDTSCKLNRLANGCEIVSSELPNGVVRIGFDHDRELDLALKLVQLSSILRLGERELVARNVLDGELVLLKDVLGLGGLVKVIETKMNTASVDRNTVGEASILYQG